MLELSVESKAYLAGLVDGKGSITAYKKAKNVEYSGAVTIIMSNPAALNVYCSLTGLGKICLDNQLKKVRVRPLTRWRICGREGKALLEQILPYMITNKEQGILYLELMTLKDFIMTAPKQEAIFFKLKALNKRGLDSSFSKGVS